MSNWFLKIFSWLVSFWSSLPEQAKEKIINTIVDTFEEILRGFYKASRKGSRT